jgi:hypothetical protein
MQFHLPELGGLNGNVASRIDAQSRRESFWANYYTERRYRNLFTEEMVPARAKKGLDPTIYCWFYKLWLVNETRKKYSTLGAGPSSSGKSGLSALGGKLGQALVIDPMAKGLERIAVRAAFQNGLQVARVFTSMGTAVTTVGAACSVAAVGATFFFGTTAVMEKYFAPAGEKIGHAWALVTDGLMLAAIAVLRK